MHSRFWSPRSPRLRPSSNRWTCISDPQQTDRWHIACGTPRSVHVTNDAKIQIQTHWHQTSYTGIKHCTSVYTDTSHAPDTGPAQTTDIKLNTCSKLAKQTTVRNASTYSASGFLYYHRTSRRPSCFRWDKDISIHPQCNRANSSVECCLSNFVNNIISNRQSLVVLK